MGTKYEKKYQKITHTVAWKRSLRPRSVLTLKKMEAGPCVCAWLKLPPIPRGRFCLGILILMRFDRIRHSLNELIQMVCTVALSKNSTA